MYDYESNPEAKGVEYQVTKVDPTDPTTKGKVYQVHKVSEEIAATLGGKVYRARIINDPTAPTVVGKVYQIVLIGDPSDPAVKGKVYNAILTGGSEVVIIGPAVSPLSLPDAIANSLSYVKAFGGTEQNGTPTPTVPVDIVSNNGTLRIQGSATGTVTQTGDPTPTTPVDPEFYQNHGLLLRAIGADADTYDASTQTITRNIGYKIFDGTESFGTSSAYGQALYISGAGSTWGADRNKDVLCQYFLGTSSPSSTMPKFTCFFNSSRHFYFRTEETAADFKAWLAELYANGTPLIVWFVNSTPETESFTPSVYADGTVETIEVTGKNLFNKSTADANRIYAYFQSSGTVWTYVSSGFSVRIPCKPNTTYTARYNGNSTQAVLSFGSTYRDVIPTESNPYISISQAIRQNNPTINTPITLTTKSNDKWLIVAYNAIDPQNTDMANNLQIELGSTATTYAPYYNGGTATAETLLKVGDYQDEQEILSGAITRNVGVKVFDGTENWKSSVTSKFSLDTSYMRSYNKMPLFCTHYDAVLANSTSAVGYGEIGLFASGTQGASNARLVIGDDNYTSVSSFKAFLANQYDAGTPVIVVYPRATPTTSSVAGQTLQVTDGDNVLEITQASLTGLELEAQYNAAVQLTIQEVQDANLDNNVTVTIQ